MSADVAPQWPDPDCAGQPTITEFCERHDLIDELVPFAHRAHDPWELARAFDAEFEALPKTAATLTANILFERVTGTRDVWANRIRTPLYLIGSWPLNDPDGRPSRWVNPYYPHQRALAAADVESRAKHLGDCCDLAVFNRSDLAARFGITVDGMNSWFDEREFGWRSQRSRARRRMARTLATASEWTGETVKSMVEPLPVTYNAVKKWCYHHVSQSEWSVPDDPGYHATRGETA